MPPTPELSDNSQENLAMKFNISPEDLIKSFNELGLEIQKAIEAEQEGKTIDDVSLEELQDMMSEAIKKEDYEKASYIRNVIDKRKEPPENAD